MPRHRYRTLIDTMLKKAVMETLERRTLLTTIVTDTNAATAIPEDDTIEYKDARGGITRIAVHGDISAEFIFAEVPTGSSVVTDTTDHVVFNDPVLPGRDLYAIYVAESTLDSYISIARFVELPTGRPMRPFGGGVTLRINRVIDGALTTVSTGDGDIYLGARTENPPFTDIPILDAPFDGLGIAPPSIADGGVLTPGLIVPDQHDLGRFLFGGAVSGNVFITGSVETFYAGSLLTGFTSGQGKGTPRVPQNFTVLGDLRNLWVGDSIGTDNGNLASPTLLTGFDMEIGGKLGQVRTLDSYAGRTSVFHSPAAAQIRSQQVELEIQDAAPHNTTFTDFQDGQLGDELDGGNGGRFNNDSFATAQYLGTVNTRKLGNNVIQLQGQLQWVNADLNDTADFYAVALMAGQTITTRLIGDEIVNLGVFDPFNRLVATDFTDQDANPALSLSSQVVNQYFRFTAKVPGVYRFAVGLDAPNFQGGSPFTGVVPYQLQILDVGDVSVGAIASVQIYDGGTVSGFNAIRGDFGGILAVDSFVSNSIGSGFGDDATVNVFRGNLRAVAAGSIGRTPGGGPPTIFPSFSIPKGSLGLVRTTASGGETTMALLTGGIEFEGFGTPVGDDIQLVDAAGDLSGGSIAASQRIGVIRVAGSIMTHRTIVEIVANADLSGADGTIEMIDAGVDMGALNSGGPHITTNPGGNLRYLHATGSIFVDTFFGGGAGAGLVEGIPGQDLRFTDDSGSQMILKPFPAPATNPATGLPISTPGSLTAVAYPIRGSSGVAIMRVTSTLGLQVDAGTLPNSGGTVEIADITVSGVGAGVIPNPGPDGVSGSFDDPRGFDKLANTGDEPLVLDPRSTANLTAEFRGAADVDVLFLRGGNFNQIRNRTKGGEIVNVISGSIGRLEARTLGLAKSHLPVEPAPVTVITGGNTFPFLDQRNGIIAGDIAEVFAWEGLGNFSVGTIETLVANSDRKGVKGVHEGINGPIVSSEQLHNINIGEGILPSGTGNFASAGLFADGRINAVGNQGLGSDIRGDIVSHTAIDQIALSHGSIINADIMVVTEFNISLEFHGGIVVPGDGNPSLDPIFEMGLISLEGIGGIIGSNIIASDINNIVIDGGFGIFTTSIFTSGGGTFHNLDTNGLGIRDVLIDGGQNLDNITINGSGKRLASTIYTPTVRFSEKLNFDPFTGLQPNRLSDIHRVLGTSRTAPRKKGASNTGNIEFLVARFSNDMGTLSAQAVKETTLNIGNQIDTIRVRDYIDSATIQGSRLNNFATGTDVLRSTFTVAGPIASFGVGATWRGTSTVNAIGPNGSIGIFATGRALYGGVGATVNIDTIQVGTDVGSPNIRVGQNLGTLVVDGSLLPGTDIRVAKTLGNLIIGGNVEDNATVRADKINKRTIKGTVFGDIIIF